MACKQCRRRKAKCDGSIPSCSTCVRFERTCEYAEKALKRGPKRRNVKVLEDRIASMEAQLNTVGQMAGLGNDSPVFFNSIESSIQAADMDFLDAPELVQGFSDPSPLLQQTDLASGGITLSSVGGSSNGTTSYTNSTGFQSADLASLDHDGSLPDDKIVDELHKIYFSDVHPCLPIIHEGRYYAKLDLDNSQKPPLCLQFAIWALAAERSGKFSHLAETFHRKSKLYMEEDELTDYGSTFLTVSHVQCWSLLSHYEATEMKLMRAWMSTRRALTLAQLLRLHILDRPPFNATKALPEAHDFIEKEERRRTFWSVFVNECWTSSGTGNPYAINEEDILTDLPCSDEAFASGLSERTQSLQDALENGLSPSSSPLASFTVLSSILRRKAQHANALQNKTDITEAEKTRFWEQHRHLENLISIVFMSRSENLRLGSALNPLLFKFTSWMHVLTISVHHTAIQFIEKYGGDNGQLSRSKTRCLQKADDIIDLMRSIAHIDYTKLYPFTGSCLYSAALVYLQNYKEGHEEQMSFENLRFAMKSLRLLARHWKAAGFFVTQLSENLEKNGIDLHESLHPTDLSTSGIVDIS